MFRRRATAEFSPAFQGRESKRRLRYVALATNERIFQPSLTRRYLVTMALIPGLEKPAYIKPSLRAEDKELTGFFEGDFLGKATPSHCSLWKYDREN